jgi:hypothetical protein
MRLTLAAGIGAAFLKTATAALEACPSLTSAEYDYIVVGAGAGGGERILLTSNSILYLMCGPSKGPLAARLALNGYKGVLVCLPG